MYMLRDERGHMAVGVGEDTDSGMTFSLLPSSHLKAISRSGA